MSSCGHVGDFLDKNRGPCEVLVRSLLRCCFFLDFGVSRPSSERIFGGPGHLWNRSLLAWIVLLSIYKSVCMEPKTTKNIGALGCAP